MVGLAFANKKSYTLLLWFYNFKPFFYGFITNHTQLISWNQCLSIRKAEHQLPEGETSHILSAFGNIVQTQLIMRKGNLLEIPISTNNDQLAGQDVLVHLRCCYEVQSTK